MTIKEAIRNLRRTHHSIFAPEALPLFCEPFGVKPPKPYPIEDSRDEFMGATLEAGPKSSMLGYGAMELARYICNSLVLDYRSCMDRGFQMQACCDALETWASTHVRQGANGSREGG